MSPLFIVRPPARRTAHRTVAALCGHAAAWAGAVALALLCAACGSSGTATSRAASSLPGSVAGTNANPASSPSATAQSTTKAASTESALINAGAGSNGCPSGSIAALSAYYTSRNSVDGANIDTAVGEEAADAPFKPIASALSGACIWRRHTTLSLAGRTATTDEDYALIATDTQAATFQSLVSAAKGAAQQAGGQVSIRTNGSGGQDAYLPAPPAAGEKSDSGYAQCDIETAWDKDTYNGVNWLIQNRYHVPAGTKFVMLVCSSTH